MKLWIREVFRVTASVIYRWPLYAEVSLISFCAGGQWGFAVGIKFLVFVMKESKKRRWKQPVSGPYPALNEPHRSGQLNSKYKGKFLGSCSVTVIHRVTAIYRAVVYRFVCRSISSPPRMGECFLQNNEKKKNCYFANDNYITNYLLDNRFLSKIFHLIS